MYIEFGGNVDDCNVMFTRSRLYRLLDRHQNTIMLRVNVPKMSVNGTLIACSLHLPCCISLFASIFNPSLQHMVAGAMRVTHLPIHTKTLHSTVLDDCSIVSFLANHCSRPVMALGSVQQLIFRSWECDVSNSEVVKLYGEHHVNWSACLYAWYFNISQKLVGKFLLRLP